MNKTGLSFSISISPTHRADAEHFCFDFFRCCFTIVVPLIDETEQCSVHCMLGTQKSSRVCSARVVQPRVVPKTRSTRGTRTRVFCLFPLRYRRCIFSFFYRVVFLRRIITNMSLYPAQASCCCVPQVAKPSAALVIEMVTATITFMSEIHAVSPHTEPGLS